MARSELVIDDDYCKSMGIYFVKQGEQMDAFIAEYISILHEVRDKALISGETANALSAYIEYTEKLDEQVGKISEVAKTQVDSFLAAVDSADQYLF